MTLQVGDHHVLDLELDNRVSRIDVPGGDGGGCNCGAHSGVSFQMVRILLTSYWMRHNNIRCNNDRVKKISRKAGVPDAADPPEASTAGFQDAPEARDESHARVHPAAPAVPAPPA